MPVVALLFPIACRQRLCILLGAGCFQSHAPHLTTRGGPPLHRPTRRLCSLLLCLALVLHRPVLLWLRLPSPDDGQTMTSAAPSALTTYHALQKGSLHGASLPRKCTWRGGVEFLGGVLVACPQPASRVVQAVALHKGVHAAACCGVGRDGWHHAQRTQQLQYRGQGACRLCMVRRRVALVTGEFAQCHGACRETIVVCCLCVRGKPSS